jgi:hypothetical protein
MADNNRTSQYEIETKNRDVFNKVHTVRSIPSNLFVFGLVAAIAIYFLFKSFVIAAGFVVGYYTLMYQIHKNDVKGLKIWLACVFDKTVVWEAGRRKALALFVVHRKED